MSEARARSERRATSRHRPRPPPARREYRQGGAGDAQFRADRPAARGAARRLAQSVRRAGGIRRRCRARTRAVFDSVADAVADCTHVYATTVRKRGLVVPVVIARGSGPGDPSPMTAAPPSCSAPNGPGWRRTKWRWPARSSPCRSIRNSASLNLAQAVILIAYEWSKHVALAVPTEGEAAEPRPARRIWRA